MNANQEATIAALDVHSKRLFVKSQPTEGRSGPAECDDAGVPQNIGRGCVHGRTQKQRPTAPVNKHRDRGRPGEERISEAEEAPRTSRGGPPRWTPSGVSGRVRVRRQRGGVPQSSSTARSIDCRSFGACVPQPAGRVKGEKRAICGKTRAGRAGGLRVTSA